MRLILPRNHVSGHAGGIHSDARKNIRTVHAAGGPLAVARQYVLTRKHTEELEALMYPFMDPGPKEAFEIAQFLASRGSAAAMLWKSATVAAAQSG